jgi:hypothetical protein
MPTPEEHRHMGRISGRERPRRWRGSSPPQLASLIGDFCAGLHYWQNPICRGWSDPAGAAGRSYIGWFAKLCSRPVWGTS